MKQYTKPTVSVVDLSVKESIAALPNAIRESGVSQIQETSAGNVLITTYNLAATAESTTQA